MVAAAAAAATEVEEVKVAVVATETAGEAVAVAGMAKEIRAEHHHQFGPALLAAGGAVPQ